MINNVTLVGRLTKDPDLRYTQSGTAVGQFTLAINRNFTNYATKGTLIGLTGRIQTRNYENQQGQRIYVTEVVTESFQLLESREVNEQRKEQATGKATFDKQSMDKPDPLDPFSPENSIVDISDNELPL